MAFEDIVDYEDILTDNSKIFTTAFTYTTKKAGVGMGTLPFGLYKVPDAKFGWRRIPNDHPDCRHPIVKFQLGYTKRTQIAEWTKCVVGEPITGGKSVRAYWNGGALFPSFAGSGAQYRSLKFRLQYSRKGWHVIFYCSTTLWHRVYVPIANLNWPLHVFQPSTYKVIE